MLTEILPFSLYIAISTSTSQRLYHTIIEQRSPANPVHERLFSLSFYFSQRPYPCTVFKALETVGPGTPSAYARANFRHKLFHSFWPIILQKCRVVHSASADPCRPAFQPQLRLFFLVDVSLCHFSAITFLSRFSFSTLILLSTESCAANASRVQRDTSTIVSARYCLARPPRLEVTLPHVSSLVTL